jgi:hypothetical protein
MPRVLRLLARSAVPFGLLACAALACAALAACDDAPGPPPFERRPPVVSDLQLSPSAFTYTGNEAVVSIPLQLSVAVDEGDGAAVVRYVVRRQFESGAVAEGTLAPADGRYAGTDTLQVERGAVGLYVVTVVASGAGGVGNEATALLAYDALDLGPPVVVAAASDPNPVPSPGAFTVTATVGDPDGLANIARVVLESGGAEFQLCDDGNFGSCGFGGVDLPAPSGDETEGDGRFSRRFQIPEGTEPGDIGFTVQAFDRAGQASAPVLLIVTVQ